MAINTVLATTPGWLKFFGGNIWNIVEHNGLEEEALIPYSILTEPAVGFTRLCVPLFTTYCAASAQFIAGTESTVRLFKDEIAAIIEANQNISVVLPIAGADYLEDITFWLTFWDGYKANGYALNKFYIYVKTLLDIIKTAVVAGGKGTKVYLELGNECTKPINSFGYALYSNTKAGNYTLPSMGIVADVNIIPMIVEYNLLPSLYCIIKWKEESGNVSWLYTTHGSVGNGGSDPLRNWATALWNATGTGINLPNGTIKTNLINKKISTLVDGYNTHYIWTSAIVSGRSFVENVPFWEDKATTNSKLMLYSEEVGQKQAIVGLAAPTLAKSILVALHTWSGRYTPAQRLLTFWAWREIPQSLRISGAEGASKGTEVFNVLAREDWLGTGSIVELGNVSGIPTEKPLANVLKLFKWDGAQHVEIDSATYHAYLFAKAGQNPLKQVVLFIIPKSDTTEFSVGRIYMDCPFTALPTGYSLSCKRLHISRLSFENEEQDTWAWGMPAVSVINDQFPGYSQGPKKTFRIQKQGTDLPDRYNWRLGRTTIVEGTVDTPLNSALYNKQDVLCFNIKIVTS